MGGSVSSRYFRHARQIGLTMVASESLQEAAYVFTAYPDFRHVFMDYVLESNWIQAFFSENPNIFLFGETDEMSYILPEQYNGSADDQTVKITFDDDLIRRSRGGSLDAEIFYNSKLTSIFTEEDSFLPLILACAYPWFLKSAEFHEWLTTQKNSSVFEQTLLHSHHAHRDSKCFDYNGNSVHEDAEFLRSGGLAMVSGDVHFIAKRTQSKQGSSRSVKPDFIRLKGFLQHCVLDHMVHQKEKIEKLLVSAPNAWLPSIKSLLDNLPAAISIASVRPHPTTHETFPLVYVNKAFEDMTQYTRAEVLGRNCRFLQSESTVEMEQVHKIRESLQSILPIKLTITNVRKDGTSFYNFLALRPVFNNANEYSYVIGVHYEVSAFDFHRFLREHNECTSKLSQAVYLESSSGSTMSYNQAASLLMSGKETEVSADLGNFARDFQMIEDLLNLLPSVLF